MRRIFELGEFVIDEELAKSGRVRYLPNVIYQWNARDDVIAAKEEPKRLFYELYRHTGLNKAEVMKDLETKTSILDWMVKNDIRDVNNVGRVISRYYTDQKTIQDAVAQNKKLEDALK